MNTGSGLAADGAHGRLYVSDGLLHRVVLYDTNGLANGMNASDGLGHLDTGVMNYTRSTLDDAANGHSFDTPAGLAFDPTHQRLFVSEQNNNRVLVFDVASGKLNASFVLGQTTFSSVTGASGKNRLMGPIDLAFDTATNRLFVVDNGNDRVVVYDTTALANGMNASFVIGQPDFGTTTPLTTQNGLNNPSGVAVDSSSGRLYVSDASNNRVLVYSTLALANGMNAMNVLGQALFTTPAPATTQNGLSFPAGLLADVAHARLYVADESNNRVLVFNTTTLTDGMNASFVLGQGGFTTAAPATSQSGFSHPAHLAMDGPNNRLFVVDQNNNRVLLFQTSALASGMSASGYIGQSSWTTFAPGTSATAVSSPFGVAYDATLGHLFVSDMNNHRVLIYAYP
jgi:DNA-binding beta-propeller fold protein YncE